MPTFEPPVTDGRRVGDPNHPSWGYFKFLGSWATGQTVWKDALGVWHRSIYPYAGGATHTVHDANAGTTTTTAPDEGLATAQEVYLGGYAHPVNDAKATELRAAGFFVGGHWETEQDKWTALAISNPEPNRSFIGGDATSSVYIPGIDRSFWAHADTTVGTIDAEGFRNPGGSLVKNSLVTRFSNGSLVQEVYSAAGPGSAPAWAHPEHPTFGFTQMDMVFDGTGTDASDVVVVGWSEPQSINGTYRDGLLLTLNGFMGAGAFTGYDSGGTKFDITSVHNGTTHHYMLGREVDLLAMFPNGIVAGQPWAQERQINYIHLARASLGSLTNPASWEFWTGTTWAAGVVNGVTEASKLRDTAGRVIEGIADITIWNGEYILVSIPSTVVSRFDLYRSATPQGPYTRYAQAYPAARRPDKGQDPPHGFGYWYGFPKFHEYLGPDSRTFLVSHSQGLYPLIIGAPLNQRYSSQDTPNFVFLPKPEAT